MGYRTMQNGLLGVIVMQIDRRLLGEAAAVFTVAGLTVAPFVDAKATPAGTASMANAAEAATATRAFVICPPLSRVADTTLSLRIMP
jgi:hypothetical protein